MDIGIILLVILSAIGGYALGMTIMCIIQLGDDKDD